jgi:hypothetical protein
MAATPPGLPAPDGLFDSAAKATATITALAKAMHDYPPRVTLREIWKTLPVVLSAPAVLEGATVVGGLGAAYYVGACLGSLLAATGQSITLPNLTTKATQLQLQGPWVMPGLTQVMARHHVRAQR